MDYIAQNPYRVLGVFANDPLRVRTANIAKIHAYQKVGKSCEFDNDYISIFGPIDRSDEAIDKAISQLSVEADAEFYSLLWLHRTAEFPTSVVAAADIIGANCKRSSKGEIINTLLAAYVTDNHSLVADALIQLFDSQDTCNSDSKHRTVNYIVEQFTAGERIFVDDWWNTFNTALENAPFDREEGDDTSSLIRQEFNSICISDLGKYSTYSALNKDYPQWKNIRSYHNTAKRIIETIKATSSSLANKPNAEGQIAMSEYANFMLKACKRCYKSNRYWDAKPVLEIISLLRELYVISYSSKVKDDCAEFGKSLKEAVKTLAPEEVHEQSVAIREEIETFCDKPDETRWALALIKNCVPHLVRIKSLLGVEHPYYIRISTQIADNALYVCSSEVESAKRKYGNPRNDKDAALKNLCRVMQSALQLCSEIKVLNVEQQFIDKKLSKFEKNMDEYCDEHEEIKLSASTATISLQTESEAFASCDDYASLQEFVRNNPNSPHIKEAMRRIWEIEDAQYPKMGLYIDVYKKAFLYYKEEFPYSHNEAKVLEAVNRFYLGNDIASPEIYRKMLALWPNHPQLNLIKERIDHATFKQCRDIESYENYLIDFPSGLHCNEARKRIQELRDAAIQEEFDKCKTIADFNRFVIRHRSHRLCQQATEKINELKESAIQAEYAKCQSIADFNRFILKYPSHKLSHSASERVEELVYANALHSGNHKEYYRIYPKGRFLQSLKEKEEKDCFKRCKTANDYKQYVNSYPNGAYTDIANAIVKRSKWLKITKYALGVSALCAAILFICLMKQCSSSDEKVSEPQNSSVQKGVSSEVQEDSTVSTEGSNDYTYDESTQSYDQYINNSLTTGSKPYSSYFGRAKTGDNYIDIKTTEGADYIVIVKRHSNGKYINHVYIRGGEKARMYVPDGTFDTYFYSGKGWNPEKVVGNLTGGFVSGESMQKDDPQRIVSAYLEYTLYPVVNGNLRLNEADINDVLK